MRNRPSPVSWTHSRVLLSFGLVFLCGLAIGSVATSSLLHFRLAHETKKLDFSTLKARLHLTPEQEVVVNEQLDDYAKYYQNIEEEREDVAEHGKQIILRVLTPEQRQLFLRMYATEPLLQKH